MYTWYPSVPTSVKCPLSWINLAEKGPKWGYKLQKSTLMRPRYQNLDRRAIFRGSRPLLIKKICTGYAFHPKWQEGGVLKKKIVCWYLPDFKNMTTSSSISNFGTIYHVYNLSIYKLSFKSTQLCLNWVFFSTFLPNTPDWLNLGT